MYPATDGARLAWRLLRRAVKPIALNMVGEIARDLKPGPADLRHRRHHDVARRRGDSSPSAPATSGVHGRDGLRLQDHQGLTDGLANFMDEGLQDHRRFPRQGRCTIADWQLNLNYVEKAVINQDLCIQCRRCHVVCEARRTRPITTTLNGKRHFEVKDEEVRGLQPVHVVCPVTDCITMRRPQAR